MQHSSQHQTTSPIELTLTDKTAALQRFMDERPLHVCPVSLASGQHDDPSADEISMQVAINRLVERYNFVMRSSLPELELETWELLMNAHNGWTEHTIGEIGTKHPFSAICDDHGLERYEDEALDDFVRRVDEVLGTRVSELLKLSVAEKMAVFEVIERYWGRESKKDFETFIADVFGGKKTLIRSYNE